MRCHSYGTEPGCRHRHSDALEATLLHKHSFRRRRTNAVAAALPTEQPDSHGPQQGPSAAPGSAHSRHSRRRGVPAAGMQPLSGLPLLAQPALLPIDGCAIDRRRPHPMGRTRLRDRRSVNGSSSVLMEQPDGQQVSVGREALQYAVTEFVAECNMPTSYGKFRLRSYHHSLDNGNSFTDPVAIFVGQPAGLSDVVVRVHDACWTSEALGSLKCDCKQQLELAQNYIQDQFAESGKPGIIIYLQQEGRGIGLANKIAAYALQDEGYDTVDANRALGFPDDCREYTAVNNILGDMGVKSIQLMTNNPRKQTVLSALGVKVTNRIPCLVQAQEYNQGYLQAKQSRMQHDLDGSYCFWNHSGEPMPPMPSVNGSGSSLDEADTF